MRSGGLVTALIAIAACRATAGITSVDGMDVRVAFDDFKAQYGKTYGSAAEDARRFAIFEANLRAAAAALGQVRPTALLLVPLLNGSSTALLVGTVHGVGAVRRPL